MTYCVRRSWRAAAAGVLPATGAALVGDKKSKSTDRDIAYRQWSSAAELATGTLVGATVLGDPVGFGTPAGTVDYTDPHSGTTHTYEYSTWTSPQVATGSAASEIIPSWTADTPAGAWIQVELRGTTELGNTTKWYNQGRWAADDNQILRTSVPSEGDPDGYVAIDTFVAAAGHGLTAWQLRLTLLRPAPARSGARVCGRSARSRPGCPSRAS